MQKMTFVAAALLAPLATTHAHSASPLDALRWKSRVLVVSAPPGDAAAAEQRRIYRAAATGMTERQIVLADTSDDGERSRQIRSALATDGRRFKVMLIGKDGHIAYASDKPLSAETLFARVDAMPMRQDEMRQERRQKEMRRAHGD